MSNFSKKTLDKSFFVFITGIFTISCICLIYIFFFTIRSQSILSVKEGYNKNNIAIALKKEKAINSLLLFKVIWKIVAIGYSCNNIHIGEYRLKKGENLFSIVNKICKGQSIMETITIPEGLYSSQILDIINQNTKLQGDNITHVEEGILLPETYTFKTGTTKQNIINKMQKDMDLFLTLEWEKRDKNLPLKTKYEALILASIVEAEAKNDAERPIIASVYINRLKKRMRLQADPTTIYEITKGNYKMKRKLRIKDLKIKGDHNTYKIYGLPKTPICNAGKKSIIATLHPAETDFLFFVAKKDLSGHTFSSTFKKHLVNKKSKK